MKKRTRLFLVVAVGVLVVGLGTGLVASYVGQNYTLIGGNGPEALAYIPADAQMVAFADMRDLVNSEVRQKLRQFEPSADTRNQLEKNTGIDVERDVDEILVAAVTEPSTALKGPPLVLARGRFDDDRIETMIREHGGTVEDYKGVQLMVIPDGEKVAVAFVEPGLVAAGQVAAVKRAIDTKKAGTGAITDNVAVMKMIKDVDDGNTWAVAKFNALSAGPLPKEIAQQLPPISWLSASGHIDSGIRGVIRIEAQDEKSATDFREVVRGFMALARLQAGQKPEFADLVNSLELGGQGTTVSLGFSVPSTVIDQIGHIVAERRRPAPDAQGVPRQQPQTAVPSL